MPIRTERRSGLDRRTGYDRRRSRQLKFSGTYFLENRKGKDEWRRVYPDIKVAQCYAGYRD